jgi:hypothetical protein
MTKTSNLSGSHLNLARGIRESYSYGTQRLINGIFILYQNLGKLFIYFALAGRVKIYASPGIQLKNKNIFATMNSFIH